MLYLESFGNPRKFARVARRVSRSKPILAVKGGRTAAGNRATSSHTGALRSASDITLGALFQQPGVIRTDTLAELFDAALLLSSQPLPTGKRVAILTNAGGPAILCADACEAGGLVVPQLPEQVRKTLAASMPAAGSTANPIDMLAAANGQDYERAISVLAACEEIDAIIVIFTPPLITKGPEVVRAIHRAARALPRAIPVLSVFMSKHAAPRVISAGGVRIPHYPFPEEAARALSLVARYGGWRSAPEETVAEIAGIERDRAAGIIAAALASGAGWMAAPAISELMACYGVPFVETRLASSPAEAAREARRMGTEVALKAIATGVLHKSDAGAVRLHLKGATQVERAARQMSDALEAAGHHVSLIHISEPTRLGMISYA